MSPYKAVLVSVVKLFLEMSTASYLRASPVWMVLSLRNKPISAGRYTNSTGMHSANALSTFRWRILIGIDIWIGVMLTGQSAGLASPAGAGECGTRHLNVDRTLVQHFISSHTLFQAARHLWSRRLSVCETVCIFMNWCTSTAISGWLCQCWW